jgi:putative PEP-CTERM system integral membrane protein
LTLFALVAVYFGIWLAFYAIPAAAALVRGFIELILHLGDFFRSIWDTLVEFPGNLFLLPFMFFGMLAFVYSATLFVLMPIAVPVLVLRSWWQAVSQYIAHFGKVRTTLVTTATAALCAFLLFFLNQQPQPTVFALLKATPADTTAARSLAAQEPMLRAGLLNAYLAPQRYISSVGEVTHIRDLYGEAFNLPRENFIGIETAYQSVASPLLYQPAGEVVENAGRSDGAMLRESSEAALLYEQYFDRSIFDGERETVLAALGSTWDFENAQQAVQDADDRSVHLHRQEIHVVEHGDWADFELHEEYQNETGERQEVVYYITLPESAVITGVWLGNSDNRDERFPHRVSPRGAAQQAYRQEVRRNIDPALVEQIGPRQYRVRIFPIEPKNLTFQQNDYGFQTPQLKVGPPLHFWLTWRTMARDSAWTMPYLAEKRNVYWDNKTVRTVNNTPLNTSSAEAGTAGWLPASLPAANTATASPHRFDLPGGENVIAQPLAPAQVPALANNLHLAVVLDRSRSMAPLSANVQDALNSFQPIASQGSTVDLYLTASRFRGEQPSRTPLTALDVASLTYIGGQNPSELLQQFAALRGNARYDGVFVLTDGTGYALGKSDAAVAAVTAPLWFVHLGSQFPLGYDDATLEQIQSSGGGVTGSVTDALNRFAVTTALARGDSFANIPPGAIADYVDNYLWFTLPSDTAQSAFPHLTSDAEFAPFAARHLILTNVRREQASLNQLNTLDELHALAKQYNVVSPYSSMIVLVDSFQNRTLDELEKQGDRFDREVEEVGQTTTFDITAVPEPHEYLLMAIGVIALVWYARKRRKEVQWRATAK